MTEEAKHEISRERRMKKTRTAMWLLVGLAAVISAFMYVNSIPPAAGKYDDFAKCIAKSSTTFYGAFWCPHCKNQKNMFGTSEQYLPYVECSLPSGSGQTQVCIDNKIEGYPTWVFKDGSQLSGEVALDKLAEKTGCALTTGK